MPNSGEFSALFEYWKIDKVVVKFVMSTTSSSPSTANQYQPLIFVAEDNNDATNPTTVGDVQQKARCRTMQLGNNPLGGVTYTIHPKPAVATFQSGAFSGYSEPKDIWLSTQFPETQNYGLKLFWDRPRTSGADIGDLQLVFEYYFSFKGVQ
jgi:hypothetical protein